MTPSRASAITSASSARVPQFDTTTVASIATLPRRSGSVPPAMPMIDRWPPGATAVAASASVASLPTQSSTTAAAPRPIAASASSPAGRPSAAGGGGASSPRRQPLGGARLPRQLQRLFAHVDGDDPRAAERRQQLHGDVAEPADADHHSARAGMQVRERPADRVVGRERGVGERGGGDRIEPAEWDEQPRRRDGDVLGEPAVAAEPAAALERLALAQVLLAAAAAAARAAAPRAIDDDIVADLHAVRARPELDHRPGHFVPERERQLVGQRPGRPVHQVQIGVAQSGAGDAQHDAPGGGDGLRDLAQLGRALPPRQPDGSHSQHPTNLKSGWLLTSAQFSDTLAPCPACTAPLPRRSTSVRSGCATGSWRPRTPAAWCARAWHSRVTPNTGAASPTAAPRC